MSAVDELKIEKVVDNLISNAIKYSHTNGRVELTLNCNEYYWSLEVRDYGLGISDNAQKKLFKEFYRGDNKVNSRMVARFEKIIRRISGTRCIGHVVGEELRFNA